MIKIKKIVAVICAFLLLLEQDVYASGTERELEIDVEEIAEKEVPLEEEHLEGLPKILQDFSGEQRIELEEIVTVSKEDAVLSARRINEIEDIEIYKAAVQEVLDEYYAQESVDVNEKIIKFTETVDERADVIVRNYEEAKKERDNAENLDYEPGKIIVSFQYGTSETVIAQVSEHMGKGYTILNNIPIDETLPDYKLERLRMAEDMLVPVIVSMDIGLDKTVQRAEELLDNIDSVKNTSYNYISTELEAMSNILAINDPFVNQQTYFAPLNVDDAWNAWSESGLDYSYYPIDVAVIDTGLDITHPDLKNKYLKDKSICIVKNIDGNLTTEIMNVNNDYVRGAKSAYHGTHVAGIISAESNNAAGVAGIASIYSKYISYMNNACNIMAINAGEIYIENGIKKISFSEERQILAIEYAVKNGAEIINMSLSGSRYIQEVQDMVNYAHAAGVTICASAGNTGINELRYPASYDNVISVGSINANREKSAFSTYNDFVDIVAYGEDVLSCIIEGRFGDDVQITSQYASISGTSMSTPMVAATAAILKSMDYSLSADEIYGLLISSAIDIHTMGKDSYTGYGQLNIGLAVQFVKRRMLCNTYPQGLTLTRKSSQSMNIQWKPLPWAEKYNLYRSTSLNGTYTNIATFLVRDTNTYRMVNNNTGEVIWHFLDQGLEAGRTYYYKVNAIFAYGYGENHSLYSPAVAQ